MRRTLLSVLALCMVAALCAPGISSAQVPPQQDTVTGSGIVAAGPLDPWNPVFNSALFGFSIDAASDPSGTTPSGRARVNGCLIISCPGDFSTLIPDLATEGRPVTCLAVSGERAVVGVEQPFGTPFSPLRPAILIYVVDGGPVGPGTAGDGMTFAPVPSVPTECPDPDSPGFITGGQVLDGDLVVHDAQPFPTSKDECKDGGWRNFPGFDNQGQCVAFVQREPQD